MEGTIQKLHERIHLTPQQLYAVILKYKPSYTLRRESGFPVTSLVHPNQVISCLSYPVFNTSSDPAKQHCKRCHKPFSLLDSAWFEDPNGCSYHLGKRLFCGGPENGLYSCCKRVSAENGCARHEFHVCEFRPVDSSLFVKAEKRRDLGVETLNVFALDCEMVYTTAGMEVVRVSVVSIYGDTVYDSLVVPNNPVLDFNTAFSGVKAEDLKGVTTTLTDVQNFLLELLNVNSILIGHGLENDLLGLHLFHQNIVDTSLVFGHERGFPYRHSLKTLAARYLQKTIHSGSNGHNSVEDAKTSLALILYKVRLETKKWRYFVSGRQSGFGSGLVCNPAPNLLAVQQRFGVFNPISKPFANIYGNIYSLQYFPGSMIFPNFVHFQTPILPIFPPI